MLTSILQPPHLIIVLIVALLVLGPKRLPEAGRALGQGLREVQGLRQRRPRRSRPGDRTRRLPRGGCAMNTLSRKRVVSELMDAYVSWREACLRVSDAYGILGERARA